MRGKVWWCLRAIDELLMLHNQPHPQSFINKWSKLLSILRHNKIQKQGGQGSNSINSTVQMADKREKITSVVVAAPMGMESSVGRRGEEEEEEEEEEDGSKSMRTAECLLRLLPMGLCLMALSLMLKNSQSNDFGSLSYSDLGAFRYLVHANGICAGYSLLSAIISAVPRPSTMSRAWTFFLVDQTLTYIILGAGAVSAEVVYLAYKGDATITWSQACGSFGSFCHKATASLAITFAVVICYAVLSLISSYRLFSKYEAPVGCYSNKGIEIPAAFHA